MVSIRELIDYYKSILDTAECEGLCEDMVQSTITALEHLEPKRVRYHDSEFHRLRCPSCDEEMSYKTRQQEVLSCPKCHQVLDWSQIAIAPYWKSGSIPLERRVEQYLAFHPFKEE